PTGARPRNSTPLRQYIYNATLARLPRTFCFSYTSYAHRNLHSFPTRRSSDLIEGINFEGKDGVRQVFIGGLLAPVESWTDGLIVDRKSTRLNSSHVKISYAVFCLKKKKV